MLREFRASGLPWADIATKLGRSPGAARRRWTGYLEGENIKYKKVNAAQVVDHTKPQSGSRETPFAKPRRPNPTPHLGGRHTQTRSFSAIAACLAGGPCSPDEEKLLFNLKESQGLRWSEVSAKLNRSPHAAREHYMVLKANRKHGRLTSETVVQKPYSMEEDRRLIRLHENSKTYEEMMRELHGRTYKSIACRLSTLALSARHRERQGLKDQAVRSDTRRRPWSVEETQLLMTAWETGCATEELYDKFPHRSPPAIKRKYRSICSERGFTPPRSPKYWSAQEDARLQQFMADGLTHEQIAARLGKTVSAVSSRWCCVKHARRGPAPVEAMDL